MSPPPRSCSAGSRSTGDAVATRPTRATVTLEQARLGMAETQAAVELDVRSKARAVAEAHAAIGVARLGREAAAERLRVMTDRYRPRPRSSKMCSRHRPRWRAPPRYINRPSAPSGVRARISIRPSATSHDHHATHHSPTSPRVSPLRARCGTPPPSPEARPPPADPVRGEPVAAGVAPRRAIRRRSSGVARRPGVQGPGLRRGDHAGRRSAAGRRPLQEGDRVTRGQVLTRLRIDRLRHFKIESGADRSRPKSTPRSTRQSRRSIARKALYDRKKS